LFPLYQSHYIYSKLASENQPVIKKKEAMKLKILTIITLIWVCQSTFGQVNQLEQFSVNTTTISKNENSVSTKNSIAQTSPQNKTYQKKNDFFFSEKEWEKTKKEIQRNKKRITSSKNGIHTSKVLDTIYLEIRIPTTNNAQITDW